MIFGAIRQAARSATGAMSAVAFLGLGPRTEVSSLPARLSTLPGWVALADGVAAADDGFSIAVARAPLDSRIRVTAGTFLMGSTASEMQEALALCDREVRPSGCHDADFLAWLAAEGPAHRVSVSTFAMDRTEVTVGQYDRCVAVGACAPPEGLRYGDPDRNSDFPVTHVRWEDAVSYCRWAGGRLPTEEEWEYSARGVASRRFPWGNVYNPHLSNHGSLAGNPADMTDGFIGLAPVGSFPDGATPEGLLDMAGNVSEWVADVLLRDENGRPIGYATNDEVDPQPKALGGSLHIIRGGSYEDGAPWLRSAARDATSLLQSARVGFRCAAPVEGW